ncbi:MAG: SIS domain-containing protein [Spirochaetota bacterium]
MNGTDSRYAPYALVREMLETPRVVRGFPVERALDHAPKTTSVFLTGEGSSRIFPAKHARVQGLRRGDRVRVELEGGEQAGEYPFTGVHLYAASNSGRTAEIVRLIEQVAARPSGGPERSTAVVATAGSPIGRICDEEFVLTCGPEEAVAATKSVIEQAFFYDVVFRFAAGVEQVDPDALADAMEDVLTAPIDSRIVGLTRGGGRVYFAGRNDGVAEELALKTNEITRRDSAFLEGTYAVHGVEEVMTSRDVVVVVDPFEAEEEKLHEVLVRGVGLNLVAIASRDTRFPTIRVPPVPGGSAYVQLLAGWNLLVEMGIDGGVNLDKPVRARKVGNEFVG